MNRTPIAVALVVVIVALAGCSAVPGSDQPDVETGVDAENGGTNSTNVTQSVGIEVDDATAGEELTEIRAAYPRDRFVVGSAQHADIDVAVDTDGDGESERTFNETHISGVNTNDYSFAITLDSDYSLQSGDVVTVTYPDVDYPSESGEYTVELRLNDEQTTNATLVVE